MKGMQFLIQSKVSISRPDDFLAEMVKSDEHMGRIKSKILIDMIGALYLNIFFISLVNNVCLTIGIRITLITIADIIILAISCISI